MIAFATRLSKYAWAVVAYNILVVLWGAYVRATGSGAGCGSHWPLCNGEVIPRAETIETAIEFTHRVTSGLAFLLVLGLLLWVRQKFASGSQIRIFAWVAMGFMVSESLVGASLVIFEWVAGNLSIERVIVQGIHLANTMLLLQFLSLVAWSASNGGKLSWSGVGRIKGYLLAGFISVLLMSIAGAVTALGDTLFPSQTLAEGIRQDFSPTAHFLVRLRVWHPVMAAAVGIYLFYFTNHIRQVYQDRTIKNYANLLIILFVVQLVFGAFNLLFLAPVWMQIVHLFLAVVVWIALTLLSAAMLSEEAGIEVLGGKPT